MYRIRASFYTSVTPFGQTGPYSQYLASDMVAWSMGGMQYICGDADRPPVRVSAPQAELHAGAQAAFGTMAAFWRRQNTGQGQHVDVSMQTSVMWTLMNATPFPPLHGINLERSGAFRSTGTEGVPPGLSVQGRSRHDTLESQDDGSIHGVDG